MQVWDLKHYWKQSRCDAIIWSATFLSVVAVRIDVGLLVDVVLSCMKLIYMSMKPHACILGHVSDTDFYLDVETFERAIEIPFVKIFHYAGSINFATKSSFKNLLCDKIKINLLKELKNAQKNIETTEKAGINNLSFDFLIIDFVALTSIDFPSVVMLNNLYKDFLKLNVKISITGCSTNVFEVLRKNDFAFMDSLHPTIHDALNFENKITS